jgi:mercuric ion transport protein
VNFVPEQPAARGSALTLSLAGIAALLASSCCVLPLVLAILGVSGAWIGGLRRMEPYSYPLTALAAVALIVAGWRIWRPAPQDAQVCDDLDACRQRNTAARRWFWVMAFLTVLPIAVRQGAHFFY